jgi:hypothetical protein
LLPRKTLKLELRIKGVELPRSARREALIALLEEHKEQKLSRRAVHGLELAELRKLCARRDIETRSIHSANKKDLLLLLREYGEFHADPEYDENMTVSTLRAELKGRGLGVSGLKKAQMLAVLRSDISYEEHRLEHFLESANCQEMVARTQRTLQSFIDFMVRDADAIKAKTQKGKGGEWEQMRKVLQSASDNIEETNLMIECYCGPTDSQNDEDGDWHREVYVVYDENEK